MSLAADDSKFVNEPVTMGKKGQQLTMTFSVEGLPAGSNPVVGVFDKQGKIVGRTEWLSNTSSPAFAKQFSIKHANSTQLTFSVYNASPSVSAEHYLGGCTADLKNLLSNGGKNDVSEGGITFHFNIETAKQEGGKKKDKGEKKVDPAAAAAARKKLLAKCDKEGGKKAQDIAGFRDMGGVSYFHVSIDSCEADFELLEVCMSAMNKPCPEDADERRGGAEDIGKVLLSYTDEKMAFYMHVPKNLQSLCNITDWYENMTSGYTVVKVKEEGKEFIAGYIAADQENNVYPIKVKDDLINKGYQYLASKQLVMPDDDDEEDVVYGDDDFYM